METKEEVEEKNSKVWISILLCVCVCMCVTLHCLASLSLAFPFIFFPNQLNSHNGNSAQLFFLLSHTYTNIEHTTTNIQTSWVSDCEYFHISIQTTYSSSVPPSLVLSLSPPYSLRLGFPFSLILLFSSAPFSSLLSFAPPLFRFV